MSVVDSIDVDIKVELGSTVMPIHHMLRLGRGAVIELDAVESDPMKIYANNALIAEGDIKIDDGRLAVEVTKKIVKPA
ncbi:MAG: FliM/FliN family flagellar motor switch protein [Hyphomicrobiaceae bacterium]|nr:FliM/FliN family flagellar motor switch protein [Hyphomicrobiaceae bacterium]MCC0023634.1 FliM/FliN family flagellar motor switch protein [Hyphomicrobiaceae bacterium]